MSEYHTDRRGDRIRQVIHSYTQLQRRGDVGAPPPERGAAPSAGYTVRDQENGSAVAGRDGGAPGPHVLRLCSAFGADADAGAGGDLDPPGGTRQHTAALTHHLDGRGVRQTVLSSTRGGGGRRERLGRWAALVRAGVRVRWLRRLWVLAALRLVLFGGLSGRSTGKSSGRPGGRPVDVVHAHQGADLVLLPLAWAAARRHRCPLVVTLHCSLRHTLEVSCLRTALLRALGGRIERWVLARADTVITLTDSAYKNLAYKDGVDREKLRVIPSGYDPDLFRSPGPDPMRRLTRPRVVYLGRLAPQKNLETLVAAFGGLRTEANLVLIGDGPQRRKLRSLVRDSPAKRHIHFTGAVPHRRVPDVLGHVDVLVLPSAYEELGTTAVEAMAAGVPVVATRVGGVPSLVHDRVTGVLVPPGDVHALAEAIDDLLETPLRARNLGEAGQTAVAEAYAWPLLAQQVGRVYEALTAGAKAGAGVDTNMVGAGSPSRA